MFLVLHSHKFNENTTNDVSISEILPVILYMRERVKMVPMTTCSMSSQENQSYIFKVRRFKEQMSPVVIFVSPAKHSDS